MGYYVELPLPREKAEQLVRLYGAELVLSPEDFNFKGDDALICVVENGLFDAAGIAYSPHERDEFNDPEDTREKVWLKLPKKVAIELCPHAKDVLYG
ncbi:MAG TPA: hypothetical protein VFH87_07450 [Candidatus Udaeobacter sp.]|nr:hypothetical protein [Candidatus Udaeobacter sp.]